MAQAETDRDRFDFDTENLSLQQIKTYIEFTNEETEFRDYQRKKNAKEVYDYYWGVRQLSLLEDEMQLRFPKTFLNRRKHVENVTKTIIDAISVVYKSPPSRTLASNIDGEVSDTVLAQMESQREDIQTLYDRMVSGANLDSQMQKLERYVNFDRTDLAWVKWADGNIKVKIVPQFLFDVVLDDEGRLSVVILSDWLDERLEEEKNYWIWTENNFWKLNHELELVENPENPDNVNPDGFIPFMLVRQVEPDDGVYCDADINLSNLNLNVNLLLSDALHLSEFQVHGQLVGKNVSLSDSTEWGPETLVQYRADDPDSESTLDFLKPDADFDGLFGTVNRLLGGFANARGLPTNMFSVDRKSVESGVALKIRNAPLVELRESMEKFYSDLEARLLPLMVQIWNNRADEHGLGMLPEDLKVNITYNRPDDAFETTNERVKAMLALKAQGLIKPTEIVMEMKPSFTQADAEKYLEEVLAEMARFTAGGQMSSFAPPPIEGGSPGRGRGTGANVPPGQANAQRTEQAVQDVIRRNFGG